VDVARQGTDATVLALRDDAGLRAFETHRGWDTMRTTGRIAQLLGRLPLSPSRVFVDDTGLGAGVTDRLREQGWEVSPVLAARRAADAGRFANVRAEAYWRLREALRPRASSGDDGAEAPGFTLPEGSEVLLRELAALTFSLDSTGAVRLAEKVALRGALGASPDHADALALTFAAEGGGKEPEMTALGRRRDQPCFN